jgi:ATPase family associated with various cellular activities (AAA)
MFCGDEQQAAQSLKMDILNEWINREWLPAHPIADPLIMQATTSVLNEDVLRRYDSHFDLSNGYRFAGVEPFETSIAARICEADFIGLTDDRMGAYLYHFASEVGELVDIIVVGAHYTDRGFDKIALAAVPRAFLPVWAVFAGECNRLNYALEPSLRVIIIGGHSQSFEPTVDWDDIILPTKLKNEIMDDVQSFFAKGVEVYRKLNLKPFRKILFAGVPGTGKTMICSALAKWGLARQYVVIYVSSARKGPGDQYGSNFQKIEEALQIAASSRLPSMIILEELDAYLHPEEKALILNVLDGSEAPVNKAGTLLISTTNYPEAIDERVLKRPGRLDRIYIVPEMRAQVDAEAMLKLYLGVMWRDEHRALVPQLVGYPGAFIREVAVAALTQVAYADLEALSYEMLEAAFIEMKAQIEARDAFIKRHPEAQALAPVANGANGNGKVS